MKKILVLCVALCLLLSNVAMADVLGEFPVVDEPVTLTGWGILATSATNTFNENAALLRLEEITGVHIEWESVTEDGAAEKRALKLASGNLPDIFFRCNMTNDEVSQLAQTGQIIPLDDLIEEHAPNIKAMFENIPGTEGAFRSEDGHIYSLLQVRIPSITNHMVINTRWLENVGLEVPTTLEEFYDVLVAFKEQDANGNGDPNDEIPLSVMGLHWIWRLMTCFEVFGTNNDGFFVYPGTSEVKSSYNQEGLKEGLKFFHKLYEEGLLDPEFLVQDTSTYNAKGTADTIGVLGVAGAFVNVGNELHFDYQGLAPFPDSNGNRIAFANEIASNNAFCITSNCEYPEAAIRWVDYLYSEDGAILVWGGVEGESYEWIDEDTWDWILPEGVGITEWRHNNTIQGGVGYPSLHPDFWESKFWSHQNDEIEASLDGPQFRQPQTDCAVTLYPALKMNADTAEEIAFIMTDISAYVTSMISDYITGVQDIDATWDEYIATLDAMGIADAVAIYQELYDNYVEMNGPIN